MAVVARRISSSTSTVISSNSLMQRSGVRTGRSISGATGTRSRRRSSPTWLERMPTSPRFAHTIIDLLARSPLESIEAGDMLTRGEVEHHRTNAPASALVVISNISLVGSPQVPVGVGGELLMVSPWTISPDSLTPIAFRYVVGPQA